MRRKTVGIAAGIIGAAVIAFFVASCGSDSTGPSAKVYVANMVPANEVPPKTATSSGTATFVDHGDVIDWTLTVNNMTNVVASHIHLGPAGAAPAGNIIFNLFNPIVATPSVNGVLARGTINNANNANISLDSLRVLFNNGNAYVNVHTTANPGGEIRDQVHPQ